MRRTWPVSVTSLTRPRSEQRSSQSTATTSKKSSVPSPASPGFLRSTTSPASIVGHYKEQPKETFPVMSSPEVWTGAEYELAAHMLHEGLSDMGLRIIQAVRERHDGERRNPWDEAECGHHYIRAMAAWSSLSVLSGFDYDGRTRELTLARRYPGATACAWTIPSGWGSYRMQADGAGLRLEVRRGHLALRTLRIRGYRTDQPGARVTIAGKTVPVGTETTREWTVLRFVPEITLEPGQDFQMS